MDEAAAGCGKKTEAGGIRLYRLMKVMAKLNTKFLFPTLHPSKHTDTIPGAALQGVRVPKRGGQWQCF